MLPNRHFSFVSCGFLAFICLSPGPDEKINVQILKIWWIIFKYICNKKKKRKIYSATPLDSSRLFLCKQECSLLKVYAFDGKRCHSRSCGSFHFPTLMFCRQSFPRKNICSNRSSGTFVHLRGTFSPQSHMLLACWCHHLKKLREKHETWKLIIAFILRKHQFLPQTAFTGQQCSLSYCFRQRLACWGLGNFSVHLRCEQ